METNSARSARLKAASEGRNKFTGNPCGVCGDTNRYTINGGCCSCHNRRSSIRQRRFREKVREILKEARNKQ